jgi:hypothetical protein
MLIFNMNNMKNIFLAMLLAIAVCTINGCTKGGNLESLTGATYTVKGDASPAQMVPAVTGVTATNTFNGWYDEHVDVLTFALTWTNIFTGSVKDVVTGIKFYGPAGTGTNGTLLHTINFINSNANGSITLALSGNNQLLNAERDEMYAGQIYYVIFTQNYPAGIIRGQLTAVKN